MKRAVLITAPVVLEVGAHIHWLLVDLEREVVHMILAPVPVLILMRQNQAEVVVGRFDPVRVGTVTT